MRFTPDDRLRCSWIAWLASLALVLPLLGGVGVSTPALGQTARPALPSHPVVKLATTTSTENAGLLGHLLPRFASRTGYQVQVISVGTGAAIRLGEDANVDVVLVHARPSEDRYMAAGHGTVRRDVMYNDFIIVGPKADPGGVVDASGGKDVLAAMGHIQTSGQRFISRGDNSGTDQMERSYWQALGLDPKTHFRGQAWYVSAGVGMGEVLTMAGQMQGYTLTDRATYGAYRDQTGLGVLVQGDIRMLNPYGIMDVNPAKHAAVNHAGALALIEWITSAEGQQAIASYRVQGEQLFFPSAN